MKCEEGVIKTAFVLFPFPYIYFLVLFSYSHLSEVQSIVWKYTWRVGVPITHKVGPSSSLLTFRHACKGSEQSQWQPQLSAFDPHRLAS